MCFDLGGDDVGKWLVTLSSLRSGHLCGYQATVHVFVPCPRRRPPPPATLLWPDRARLVSAVRSRSQGAADLDAIYLGVTPLQHPHTGCHVCHRATAACAAIEPPAVWPC